MSTSITWNNTAYSIPASGEVAWSSLSLYLIAIGNNAQTVSAQKAGIRVATSTPITISAATDYTVISKLTVAGAVAVTLPTGVDGQIFYVVDGTGDANTNNITITGSGGQLINGGATYVINASRGAVGFQFSSSAGEWKSVSASTTGAISIAAFGSSPNANGLSVSGLAVNMQPADATHPGGVSIASQTFAGLKTFADGHAGTWAGAASSTGLKTFTDKFTGPWVGVATNSDAAAGDVGEYKQVLISASDGVSGAFHIIGQLDLTAGDWDVSVIGQVTHGADGTFTSWSLGISSNNTADSSGMTAGDSYFTRSILHNAVVFIDTISIANYRVSLSGSASYYVKETATWTSGSALALSGRFSARRVR